VAESDTEPAIGDHRVRPVMTLAEGRSVTSETKSFPDGSLVHDSGHLIEVGVDAEALCGDKKLFRIDGRRVGQDKRRGGGRHLDATVESDHVLAAVTIVDKSLVAALPGDLSRVLMLAHRRDSLQLALSYALGE
jgi:hypothetical protein